MTWAGTRHSKQTKLVAVRQPNARERKSGAEVVFEREDEDGRKAVILASRCYESWQQWGAITEVLADNVDAVERWRRAGLESFDEELQV